MTGTGAAPYADLPATVRATPGSPPDQDERLLYGMIPHRRANRFPFDSRPLPRNVLLDLVTATAHGVAASLFSQPLGVRPPQHRGDQAGPLGYVQTRIRFGYGPPVPPVPRRPVFEVLDRRAWEARRG